mmetsp:Transcript_32448/g.48918  ORF Transcript_32448/g.48918 Transcript_32448/m.48918 type:complete len:120 (-) Transcript_32448:181-540(-)|eukprot:CAMPEP_0178916544 /NCGR_PEP_ID=MMETSP0786-20121207/12708_1 /TAXON_ID=186022 /ORGANISM="Thalassionema frauenfeldii, Strain CCMP 1798" /LENGTH=119 /DNA_ID=CAMNT_0020589911 /DNA_START=34 /DNA_END=393 /DNA_ORIENTATION=-
MIFSTAFLRNHIRRSAVLSSRYQSSQTARPLIQADAVRQWYNVFGKSTAGYVSWIVIGVLVAEALTGATTDFVWNSINRGRTYESIDWSKFASEDDDDDEDDEEEDEDEDGDDDDDDDE